MWWWYSQKTEQSKWGWLLSAGVHDVLSSLGVIQCVVLYIMLGVEGRLGELRGHSVHSDQLDIGISRGLSLTLLTEGWSLCCRTVVPIQPWTTHSRHRWTAGVVRSRLLMVVLPPPAAHHTPDAHRTSGKG